MLEGSDVFDITILPSLIETQIEEIFKRIEHTDNREARVCEANYAWFQLFGMRKVIAQGGSLHFNLRLSPDSEEQKEYRRIIASLNAALEKAEAIYEEMHQEKPR